LIAYTAHFHIVVNGCENCWGRKTLLNQSIVKDCYICCWCLYIYYTRVYDHRDRVHSVCVHTCVININYY